MSREPEPSSDVIRLIFLSNRIQSSIGLKITCEPSSLHGPFVGNLTAECSEHETKTAHEGHSGQPAVNQGQDLSRFDDK